MDPLRFVAEHQGIATTAELTAAGARRRELTDLVSRGELRRPRAGWYSTLDPDDPRFRAVRVGGFLTGASALSAMGAWMLHPPAAIEVAVVRGSARLRADPGVALRWGADAAAATRGVCGLSDALLRVVLDHDLEVSVPALDWALHTARLDRIDFERLLLDHPQRARWIREWVDSASESVLESVARVRLRRRGWRVTSQVRVGDLGAIDLVVADCVAVELDGREHHENSFEKDRRKDLQITLEGRHCLRVTYSMVINEWPRVDQAIAAALAARGVGHHSVTPPREPSGTRRRLIRAPGVTESRTPTGIRDSPTELHVV